METIRLPLFRSIFAIVFVIKRAPLSYARCFLAGFFFFYLYFNTRQLDLSAPENVTSAINSVAATHSHAINAKLPYSKPRLRILITKTVNINWCRNVLCPRILFSVYTGLLKCGDMKLFSAFVCFLFLIIIIKKKQVFMTRIKLLFVFLKCLMSWILFSGVACFPSA